MPMAVVSRKMVLRNAADAALPSMKGLLGYSPSFGVVFHHIPKCAGTSVYRALRRIYPPWELKEIDARASAFAHRFRGPESEAAPQELSGEEWMQIHRFRHYLLLTYLYGGARGVAGHLLYHPEIHQTFEKTHVFATILRHPVERFASQYLQHLKSNRLYHTGVSWDREGLSSVGSIWGRTLANYLGGNTHRTNRPTTVEEEVTNAKLAINTLDVVGFLDDLPAFQQNLGRRIGNHIRMGQHNKSSPEKKEMFSGELKKLVEDFCAPDLEVYYYARARRYK